MSNWEIRAIGGVDWVKEVEEVTVFEGLNDEDENVCDR
jgi:hypothetical protein